MSTSRYETRAVAGAVNRPRRGGDLTHTVEIRSDGTERVLCRRVRLEHLLDDVFATNPNAPPTCPECLRRLTRILGGG